AGRIFAGGGGGAAQQNNGDGGAGGTGGGIAFLLGNIVNGTGQIRANATNGGDSIDEHRDGAGGGGGGGSLVVVANAVSGVSLEARGGNGGTHGKPIGRFGSEIHGPGGGGGGGFTAVSGGAVVSDVTGGSHGVSLANFITEFPVNGATRGAPGVGGAPIVSIPFACATDLAILKTSASTSVTPGQTFSYSIVATNSGPNAVVGAKVVDTLPASLINATWTCTATAGSACPVPANGSGSINTTVNLLVNGSATFILTATVAASAPASIANTATITSPSGALDPTPGNNTSTYTVLVSRGVTESLNSRLISNDTCIGAGKFLTVQNGVANNGPGTQLDNPGPEFISTIPATLELIDNSCVASSGSCATISNRVEWNGTLLNGQSVSISFQVKVKNTVTSGTRFCVTTRVNYDSNGDGTNDTSVSDQACATANCVAVPGCVGAGCGTLGPGPIFPYNKGISDQAPGSVLIYPIYTSSAAEANTNNTRISMTNTSTTSPANVHLFFVEGSTCSVYDKFVCLTENQTITFLMSELDPGTTGYLVAVATDLLGCPVSHNFLIGDEYLKTAIAGVPFFGSLGAEAISALFDGSVPGCDANSVTATIPFNGVLYEPAPRVLALDNILSRADGNRTWLIIDRVGGTLITTASSIGGLFGVLFDDQEEPASFNTTASCQLRAVLGDDFPKTVPRFELKIPTAQSGWMKIWNPGADVALIGAAFNSNTTGPGFNGAHTLHKLTLSAGGVYTIPVFPPSC
ncbi:MAG: DUF11 domain-containing protein, partial [Acidobacteriota bacterium]